MSNYDLPVLRPGEDNSGFNVPDQEENKPPQPEPEKSAFSQILSEVGRFIYEVIKTTAIIVIAAFVIRFFLIQPFVVEGESMEPNFHNNEYLIIQKVSGYLGSYKRGDVIVFKYPNNPEVSYIKRIIALPGEKVTFNEGTVTIYNTAHPNGVKLEENYILTHDDTTNMKTEKVLGVNEYFVLGDNRNNSSDSREWGTLDRKFIQGKVFLRLYPLSEISLFKAPQYSY